MTNQRIPANDIEEHIPILQEYCLQLDAKKVLELGVRDGISTKAFLFALDKTDGQLISVDRSDCSKVSDSPRWKFIKSDDMNLQFNEIIDILFIDTSHKYAHTLAELKKYGDLVRKGGMIFLHDTVRYPEVMDAIREYLRTHLDIVFNNLENCNGLGILEKI